MTEDVIYPTLPSAITLDIVSTYLHTQYAFNMHTKC